MTATDQTVGLLTKLEEFRKLCPQFRLGQMLAAIGNLGEDETGLSLWEIEDEQLAAAVERFANSMRRINQS